jgi:hypothetical protein
MASLNFLPRTAAALGLALLAGCAAMNTVTSEVSTYGAWPSGRSAGSFAIERLPSQQAQSADLLEVEAAAQAALQAAGFTPVATGGQPDVVVQLGARVSRQARSPWDDPMWLGFGFSRWNWPHWGGPGWGWTTRYESTTYAREVAVLIRDRSSSQPLYEARARTDGISPGGKAVIGAMFMAAMKDFPAAKPEPHDVAVASPP